MHRLTIHAIVFAAVSGLAIFAWMALDDSMVGISDVAADPTAARSLGFWPIWLIAPWLTLLIIHAGVTCTYAVRNHFRTEEPETPGADLVEDGLRKTAELAGGLLNAAVEKGASAITSDDDELAALAPGVGEQRWVAVMFTDIEDSTALTEEMGDESWHKVLTRHRKVVRRCIDDNRGEEVKTQGDGFFIRFDTAPDAVHCALAIQGRLSRRRYRDLPPLRIGIHAGEAVQDDDGDLMGKVINVAARVTDAAEAGEILVTESVADNVDNEVKLEDGGLRDLKGVAQPRHVLKVVR
ncbi:MAG: adenylate/guanylate cyclase domain-containing protein [Actinomycetota bacterium]